MWILIYLFPPTKYKYGIKSEFRYLSTYLYVTSKYHTQKSSFIVSRISYISKFISSVLEICCNNPSNLSIVIFYLLRVLPPNSNKSMEEGKKDIRIRSNFDLLLIYWFYLLQVILQKSIILKTLVLCKISDGYLLQKTLLDTVR